MEGSIRQISYSYAVSSVVSSIVAARTMKVMKPGTDCREGRDTKTAAAEFQVSKK
jgi:hypothetical protein